MMNENLRRDLLELSREILDNLEKDSTFVPVIKQISGKAIHFASIFQDKDSTSLAVIEYAIYKVLSHPNQFNLDEVKGKVIPYIKKIQEGLEQNSDLTQIFSETFKEINNIGGVKLKKFIDDVVFFAKIKKGSKLHEEGLSVARAAQVLGVSRWDILNYSKRSSYDEQDDVKMSRLDLAREIFDLQ